MRNVFTLAGALMLLAGAVGGAASAQGQATAASPAVTPLSTATLANLCGATGEGEAAMARGYCRGFIIGVGQYHAEITRSGGPRPAFCLPDPAPSLEAAQASFVAWAASNPQYASDKAVDGLLRWASTAYPCPQATARRAGQR